MTPAPAQSQDPKIAEQQALVEKFGKTLDELISGRIEQEVVAEKSLQYLRWRRADLYMRGLHHVYPDVTDGGQVTMTGSGMPTFGKTDQSPQFDYSFPVVSAYGQKFTAVLGQRPFYEGHFAPDDPKSEADRQAADQANTGAFILDSWWNVRKKNLQLAHSFYKSGTTFPYLRWVSDGERYGYYVVPKFKEGAATIGDPYYQCLQCEAKATDEDAKANGNTCAECGADLGPEARHEGDTVPVPESDGEAKYPNGRVQLIWMNSTMVTVPFYAQELIDCPWLIIDSEEPIGAMIRLYPRLRSKLESATVGAAGSSLVNQGALARSGAQSQAGTPRSQGSRGQVPCRRIYLRATELEVISDATLREELKAKYPKGLRIVKVGENTAEITGESMDDHLGCGQPVVGDYIMVDGVCWNILGHHDLINDFAGLAIEHLTRGMPTTIVEQGLLNVDAINNRRSLPQEILETSSPAGQSLDSMIKTLPAARFPDQLQPLVSWIDSDVQSTLNLFPQVYGQTDSTRKTAEQSRSELNQALMGLGTTGEFMSDTWRQCKEIGVRLLAENLTSPLSHQGKTLDVEVLRAGNYHWESEIGIPRTYAERKDAFNALLQNGTPMGQQVVTALKLLDPINYDTLTKMADIQDLENPNADHQKAVQEIIDQLWGGQPIQQADGSMAPSIPFEEDVLDPQMTLLLVSDYLLQQSARAQAKTNPAGYQNIIAFKKEAQKRATPPPPPPPPPKVTVGVALKGEDLGDPAVQNILNKEGLVDQGTPVQAVPAPIKAGQVPSSPQGPPPLPPDQAPPPGPPQVQPPAPQANPPQGA